MTQFAASPAVQADDGVTCLPLRRAPDPVIADWLLAHRSLLQEAEWYRLASEIGLLRRAR